VVAILAEAVRVDASARATRLDPSWPPVLVAFAGAAVSAVLVLIIVVFRRLRGDARRKARGQGGGR
jgi:hypothetical protein